MEREWFQNPKWAFSASTADDAYISSTFSYLLDAPESITSLLERILVYDQLPRHMFRGQPCNHIIQTYLQKALEAQELIDLDELDPIAFTFALLPLRHTLDPDRIYKAMQLCWARIERDTCASGEKEQEHHVLCKFLKASYERCPLVNASASASASPVGKHLQVDRSILAFDPQQEPCHVRVSAIDASVCDMTMTKTKTMTKLVLSISGGVDSMICSWILSRQTQLHACIHINYCNRDTSDREADFVSWWCAKLGVPLYIRRIDEIKRAPCMKHGLRSTYETYTRNVRYHCYKQFGADATIVLGHNKDDVLENIFTNIAQKSKYENLDGMTASSGTQDASLQEGIQFLRPLLKLTKSQIFEFAHKHNVPYLPCSTPTWAQRGQIRANVVPVVNKWHANFTESMHYLSDTLKELNAFASVTIDGILEGAVCSSASTEITMDVLHDSVFFWRMLLSKVGIHNVSTRSLDNLCVRIKSNNPNKLPMLVVLTRSTKISIIKDAGSYLISIMFV